ncbi:MAG: lipopolysaccharide transport periplasmic protein LptA [Proteobacteria bacterium]|jgi:lipopolysaccharide export system protein LptA|nr:lipopolysaccharide transport periplasmic protein LptA [Pseudomonadota bacterium]
MKNLKSNIFTKKIFLLISLIISFDVLSEKSDKDKPIEIEADSMTVDDSKSTSIYEGDVILTQGTLIIKADTLIVREDKQGFQHSTSIGKPTTFKQKMEGSDKFIQGKALRIEYDGHMDKIHLYKNAEVKRGDDIVVGDYITYDANAEIAQAMSNNSSTSGKKSRTKAIIKPKD